MTTQSVAGIGDLSHDRRIAVARSLLRLVQPLGLTAYVDGFSDAPDLPAEVTAALERIRERAPVRRRLLGKPQPTYMAVPLSVADADEFELVVAFAPYSIHTELVDEADEPVLVLHDTSTSLEIAAPVSFVPSIEAALPDGVSLVR